MASTTKPTNAAKPQKHVSTVSLSTHSSCLRAIHTHLTIISSRHPTATAVTAAAPFTNYGTSTTPVGSLIFLKSATEVLLGNLERLLKSVEGELQLGRQLKVEDEESNAGEWEVSDRLKAWEVDLRMDVVGLKTLLTELDG
ncbi:hypothetical protein H2203_006199 [Taxawa tesnikishii (nom. ined.)]|nr:hypothetical protein H2203_006199 [Dothideales sp. JES 119]